MRILSGIMILFLLLGLAEPVQVGGTSEKLISIGSLSRNAPNQTDAANLTNVTDQMNKTEQANATDEANATNQLSTANRRVSIAIKNPMSTIPVSNAQKSAFSPNSAQANSIAYRFTT